MRAFQTTIVVLTTLLSIGVLAQPQHQQQQAIDPAYLRQYYQQISAQTSGGNPEATPIFEQNQERSQQYISPGQQIRVKDNVQDQIRAQQQQQPHQTQAYVAPSVREYLQQQGHPQQVQYVHQQQQQQQQPQAQQVVYRPQVAAGAPKPRPRPQQQQLQQHQYQSSGGKLKQDEEEYEDPASSSYQFGFDVKDDEFTNYQNRKEVREGNVITGSYSVVDSDGFIRTVKYTADPKEGFKAEVIREPTDIVIKVPTPAPQQQLLRQQHSFKQQPQEYQTKQYHQYQQ